MAPNRRKGASKAAAAAAARRQWKIGDLVLAKVKGFPAWPAAVSEPKKWGYSSDTKKVLVYFFGTQQIAFCNPADVEAFTEEKKETLLLKRHGKGSDFVRAAHEIIESYEKLKKQDQINNVNSSDEATVTNENKSMESSTESGLKDEEALPTLGKSCVKKLNSSDAEHGPSLPTDDTTATTSRDTSEKEMLSEVSTRNLASTETETVTVNAYSLRRKNESMPPQKHVIQKRPPSARRSRSSSRVDSTKFQNLALPFKTSDGNLPMDGLQVGPLKRNRLSRKSPDSSELQDEDSLAALVNASIEENGSEIVTDDSDTHSLNEGSAVDSGCKTLQHESGVDCCDEDVEMSQKVDFQTKPLVLRKKRKPTRKRSSGPALEVASGQIDKGPTMETMVYKADPTSSNDIEKPNGKCYKEDGDEHLPLVKRARVRMSRSSSAGEELDTLVKSEEKSFSISNKDLGQSLTLKFEDSPTVEKSLIIKEQTVISSPLNKFSFSKSQPWEARKAPQYSSSVDGEAALPPSKRLHRALEAMSANVAENFEASNEAPAVMKTSINGILHLASVEGSDIDLKRTNAGIEQRIGAAASDSHDITCIASDLKPLMTEKSVEASIEVAVCNRTSSIKDGPNSEPEFCKDILISVNTTDVKDLNVVSLGDHSMELKAVDQTPRSFSPDLVGGLACPASNQLSVEQIPPSDDCMIANSEFKKSWENLGSGKSSDPTSGDPTMCIGSSQTCSDLVLDRAKGKCSVAFPLNDTIKEGGKPESMEEVNPVPKDSILRPSPILLGSLLAAAQEPHISQSTSVSEGHLSTQAVSGIQSSSSPVEGLDSTARASSLHTSICNMSASDQSNSLETNTCYSPEPHVHYEIPKHTSSRAEVNSSLTSFESILGTLTRTKESIGRATRFAIDCAKFGTATKVVDILSRGLERATSLRRRVDLFFLVDSITQCSRGLKGDGGVYPSEIQAVLPRLLLAAAPPGSSAQENRRQCLKVLRVWQERRILPDSIIRRHIRELESFCSSSSGAFSRRPLRTERAFDDPIREMEGMMVDEYGSNSSFQLPGFCMPPMLKDGDEGSDSDEEAFEAVTPEHNPDNSEARIKPLVAPMEKHRHILEDVDGELEMEDVAPSCEAEVSATGKIIGISGAQTSSHQFEQHIHLPYGPPLPSDVPPSSPPLPNSPPPPPPPAQIHPQPQLPSIPPPSVMSGPIANGFDSNIYMNAHILQDNLTNSSTEQPVAPRVDQMILDNPHSHAPEGRDRHSQVQRQMPDGSSCCSYNNPPASHPSVGAGNNSQQTDGAVTHSKVFPVRPPYPAPSNQFSYVQMDQRLPMRRDIPPPSYPNRSQLVQNTDGGNFYTDHDRMKPVSRENWRFSGPSFTGPRHPDNNRMFYGQPSYGPREAHRRWAYPPRGMNHRSREPMQHHRSYSDGPIPVSARAPSSWRPR